MAGDSPVAVPWTCCREKRCIVLIYGIEVGRDIKAYVVFKYEAVRQPYSLPKALVCTVNGCRLAFLEAIAKRLSFLRCI
jgi:hypothetical protein